MKTTAFPTAILIAAATTACQQTSPGRDTTIDIGGGGGDHGETEPVAVMVDENPFRLCFGDGICTSSGTGVPIPQPYSYTEGPRPQVNPQTATAFPAFGWVVGETRNEVIPTFIWQGNRLSGMDTGTLYEVSSVAAVREFPDRTEIDLNTNYTDPTPALLTIRQTPSGAVEANLQPPPAMAAEGIALTLFTIETPPDEGLFGMGARKDFFNQRGLLRNVWTEQQNTGLGAFNELDLSGVGAFGGSPISTTNPTTDVFDATGVNPDVDDAALAEERTSFPNGAQAAYWVEAAVFGSRGWAAWTTDMYFQRIDLAATNAEKLRWQVVDSDEVTLVFADGNTAEPGSPIEQASRVYTAYWGRAPAPTPVAWLPWIDTLNQGEGEAAPNGQGFWGGQRARCEVEGFIARSEQYDIPFGLVGIEGWHTIPLAHPDCVIPTTAEICEHASGFPFTEDEWRAEVDDPDIPTFFDVDPNCAQANQSFYDFMRAEGFDIAGYWNFFTTNHNCPNNDATQCPDDQLGVPIASKQAYVDGRQRDIYVKAADPNADTTDDNGDHTVTTNRGGISSLVDFTNDAAIPFWKEQLARLLDLDIQIFMHDFGELTTDDMLFAEGENLQESHNLFAFKYQRAARISLDEYKAENGLGDAFAPYYYARAGMTGACSFTPGVFPGDESTSWDQGHGLPSVIPTMLNLSLTGCYAFTTDIGGYFDVTTPRTKEDLFIRWSQLSALTPTMRIHSSTFNGSVFPWTWEEGDHDDPKQFETTDIFARYARLKINLIPLIEHWVERAVNDGDIGPVRPIILEDASATAQAIDYQWLLGDDILVAPVVFENAATSAVYFPTGSRWQRVLVDANGRLTDAGEIHNGGQSIGVTVNNMLTDIPIFVRCGSSDPLIPTDGSVGNCMP